MLELGLGTTGRVAAPRKDDGVWRRLLTPTNVVMAGVAVASFGFNAGKWLDHAEHTATGLEPRLLAVERQAASETLDAKYVRKDVYQSDQQAAETDREWIKQTLREIKAMLGGADKGQK